MYTYTYIYIYIYTYTHNTQHPWSGRTRGRTDPEPRNPWLWHTQGSLRDFPLIRDFPLQGTSLYSLYSPYKGQAAGMRLPTVFRQPLGDDCDVT